MKKAMRSMECLVEDSDNDNEEEEEDHGDQEGVPPEAWRSVKDEATGRTYIYILFTRRRESLFGRNRIESENPVSPTRTLSFSCVNNTCA